MLKLPVAFIVTLLVMHTGKLCAQEYLLPLKDNPVVDVVDKTDKKARKTTAISLPFFEDFTTYSVKPDEAKWVDNKVYINNTMCVNPISRGVATFDALNQFGLPYEAVNSNSKYADSLTSQRIDLSTHVPSDSIYLSFFYQPQGNGFYPEPEDSLMLFMRTTNAWTLVWSTPGNTLQPFKQVILPVTDSNYFHDGFQIRFVNKATMVLNDDVWNVDYIKLDANRGINDTAINDVAYTIQPTSFLSDYTSMPFHQYKADANTERAVNMEAYIRNNGTTGNNVNHNLVAKEVISNSNLSSNTGNNLALSANNTSTVSFTNYTTLPAAPQKNHPSIFENKYYIESVSANDRKENDTIVHNQIFHNYLAYDDGTAEKSYFLNQFPTLPGKTAIEYHLNEPDTLNGISIYFGRQLPLATNKYFSVAVYSDIAFNGGTEKLIFQEDFLNPVYSVVNHMWTYKFNKPVPLPAGTFYIGTIQPALSSSDSLYFGVDVNRVGANHLYYNVLNTWQSSNITGALMIRPVFGTVFPSAVANTGETKGGNWSLTPNPATDIVTVKVNSDREKHYEIVDVQGRVMMRGVLRSDGKIQIGGLHSGMYFVHITIEGLEPEQPQKLIKI
ncbi:MAG: T9SS type A sorting domain-containing protein [Flavipsychrobacter sp.]